VDGSVLSELAKANPAERVRAWAGSIAHITVCALTVEEVQRAIGRNVSACQLEAADQWLTRFLASHCEVLAVAGQAAREAGRLRTRLALKGKHLSQTEAVLAVIAMERDLLLVTLSPATYQECALSTYNPLTG
jgi:predicted nucleic acid-binding protein